MILWQLPVAKLNPGCWARANLSVSKAFEIEFFSWPMVAGNFLDQLGHVFLIIEKIKNLLRSSAGIYVAGGVVLIGAITMFLSFRTSFGGFDDVGSRTFISLETGQPFRHTLTEGEKTPIYSPSSGKNDGYPAEACYWSPDGTPKTAPTWVLLNQFTKKPGPTFCPECGRLVINNNPVPVPGQPSAPTRAEYEKNPSKYPLFN